MQEIITLLWDRYPTYYPVSEVPDTKKSSTRGASEVNEDEETSGRMKQSLVPTICQHLIKVTPARVQHNHKSLYFT